MAFETRNYTLGRGEVHFAKFAPGTQNTAGERYIGNTPNLSWAAEVEMLDHYNSDEGIREKDESIVLQVDRNGTVECDNIAMENLALFFFGDASTVTVTPATSEEETLTAVQAGLWYQLGTSAAAPAGLRMVSNLTAVLAATPLVAGTDYELDPELGRIRFMAGDAFVEGEDVGVTFDVAGHSFDRVISGSQPVEGALRFIAKNPAGKQIDYFLPWVKLTPSGDYALKGDEWQVMTFNIEILKKPGYEAVYADGRPTAIP